MSCPKTVHLLQEYFSDSLSVQAGAEFDKHLAQCGECRAELDTLLLTRQELLSWQEQRVPHWDRGLELFKREHAAEPPATGWFGRWQWAPTAASFAMLCLLLLNTSVSVSDSGFEIAFGGSAERAEIESLIRRFEARQDSNNVQLLQAVMEQTQQSTAESLDRIYAYFEEQRLRDLQDMQLGYQQLADSDYATLRSLQELAQFVSYRESAR
jgi:hypothetical protein